MPRPEFCCDPCDDCPLRFSGYWEEGARAVSELLREGDLASGTQPEEIADKAIGVLMDTGTDFGPYALVGQVATAAIRISNGFCESNLRRR